MVSLDKVDAGEGGRGLQFFEETSKHSAMGRGLGPAVLKGQSHGMEKGAA